MVACLVFVFVRIAKSVAQFCLRVQGQPLRLGKMKRPEQGLLSFADEGEEEEEFVPLKKRKQLDQGHAKPRKSKAFVASPAEPEAVPVNTYLSSAVGMYSTEALQELRKNSVNWNTSKYLGVIDDDEPRDMDEEPAEGEDTAIPSASLVRQAKEQRDLARRTAPSAEVHLQDKRPAPLQLSSTRSALQIPGNTVLSRPPASPAFREDGMASPTLTPRVAPAEDDDEAELNAWERDQMRHAGVRRLSSRASEPSTPVMRRASSQSFSGGTMTDPARTFRDLCQHLSNQALQLRHRNEPASPSTKQAQLHQATAEVGVISLRKRVVSLQNQLQFLLDIRDYVYDLSDCFDEKSESVRQLLERVEQLHIDLSRDRIDRSKQDVTDELDEALIAFGASVPQEEVDEFGRDIGHIKSDRRRRRLARRQRGLKRRQSDGKLSKVPEGWSTAESGSDDEVNKSLLKKEMGLLGELFSDAKDEFASLTTVRDRLESFKLQYPTAYSDAYVGVSLPSIFGPFVSMELANWDPLRAPQRISEMDWYNLLIDFGLPVEGPLPDGAEIDLVPTIVKARVAPLAAVYLRNALDPLSLQHTQNATLLVEDLLRYCSPKTEEMQGVFRAVINSIRQTSETLQLHLPACTRRLQFTDEDVEPDADGPRAEAFRKLRRIFWVAVKLMYTTVAWANVLHPTILQNIVVKDLLCKKVLPHLASLPLTSSRQVGQCLSTLHGCLNFLPQHFLDASQKQDQQGQSRTRRLVRPVLDFLRRDVVPAYLGGSEDTKVEAELSAIWGQLDGDEMELERLLRRS
eukprot:TRINITY_DN17665_c0_g1_i1.p1 TRINITY_DN17665_c0_g1~~TRINITY_DN17665_c0_g1_i1.p1  ORF type:complete len:799 (-),score=112.51 TRINITY_DN17665_c0_g1_i1:10-2406(-)